MKDEITDLREKVAVSTAEIAESKNMITDLNTEIQSLKASDSKKS